MAKASSKLTKLKSVLKKLNSFNTKPTSHRSCSSSTDEHQHNLHPVYVGKSRRRYLVSSDIIDHPLFQELATVSNINDDGNHNNAITISVSCEVVLFEHLLWMLENSQGDNDDDQSLDELVQFYAC